MLSQKKQFERWQEHITRVHYKEMDLTLERIKSVAQNLQVGRFSCPVITVAGTNGKSSCVAFLEQIYLQAGYKVGAFSSPFLLHFNEQVRLHGELVCFEKLNQAFSLIEEKRGEVSLTSFEFLVLAALVIFQKEELEVVILEVGLGGKDDAVNIVESNLSILTNVALDHAEQLGQTREEIAEKKAGIFRRNQRAVYGEKEIPRAVLEYAKQLEVQLFAYERDFLLEGDIFTSKKHVLKGLPVSKLAKQNISTALMAVFLLQEELFVKEEAIFQAISVAHLPGRFEVIHSPSLQIVDVAHNPAAAQFLSNELKQKQKSYFFKAVFSMLREKDIVGTIAPLSKIVDTWYIAPIREKRAASLSQIMEAFRTLGIEKIRQFSTLETAYLSALSDCGSEEALLVYGSFRTVSAIYPALISSRG